jgi:formylglycine-generating enzyme required for sulfatase activity
MLATCCEPNKHPERAEWQARITALLADGVKPCVPQKTILLGKRVKIPMTFSFIPPGSFLMGSPEQEEGRQSIATLHPVSLTKGFWLGTHEVTQAQWQRVLGKNPSLFKGDENRPVERITWDDCQGFCRKMEEKTEQRFRLPTEAEWEYSCRAGTTTPFFFGATISTDQANYHGDYTYGGGTKGVYRKQTTPVGQFPPNAWGLYDLHGNLWDWCQDGYGEYNLVDIEDPLNDNKTARVLRGGSWGDGPSRCRSAFRNWNAPFDRTDYCGCRLVCLD